MLKTNKGTAVVIALLSLLILSTLGASVLFSTQAEITTTYNFKRLTQARYAAEAGAQSTANWLIYNYTAPTSFASYDMTKSPVQYSGQAVVLSALGSVSANYPDSAVQTAFNTALNNHSVSGMDVGMTYSTTATMQTMRVVTVFGSATQVPLQSWLIRSQATVGSSQARVEVTTTIERFGSPVFPYAAFAISATCGALKFGGGANTDSFDSTLGTYATTQQFSSGNVGTNGNADLNGSTTEIYGTVSSPYSTTGTCGTPITALTLSGGATVSGGTVTLASALSYATPAAPSPAPPTITQSSSGNCGGGGGIPGCTNMPGNNLAFAPGQYGDVKLSGGAVLHVSTGIYNMNSISFAGNSQLIVDSGPVVINIAGAGLTGSNAAIDMTGGTISNVVNSKPTDLQILYGGSQPVKLAGSSSAYAVAYMPNAPVTFTGGSDWFGAVVGNTVTDTGGTDIHYDRSLGANVDIIGNYHTTSFGWSKY